MLLTEQILYEPLLSSPFGKYKKIARLISDTEKMVMDVYNHIMEELPTTPSYNENSGKHWFYNTFRC